MRKYDVLLKGFKPLCCYNNGLILYRLFKFYFFDKHSKLSLLAEMQPDIKRKVLSRIRLTERLFRLCPKASILVENDKMIFSFLKAIYSLDINKGKIDKITNTRDGFSDPLNFSLAIKKTKFIALYGDYGANNNKDEVYIYGISKDYSIKKIYTFKAGSVRHIHNIIIDSFNNEYYIFTGDNEISAGIYKADSEMSSVVPVATGNQLYRAVSGFCLDKGLLYTTDSVSSQNYICFLEKHDPNYRLIKLKEINGPCIHGVELRDRYLFSTTVESDESNTKKYLRLISNKKGKGIKTNYVDVISVDKNFKISILCSFKKDIFPMKLFQYGKVKFPENLKINDEIIIYPIAVKKYDDTIIKL